MAQPGQHSGHPGFSWNAYIEGLAQEAGSLAAVAAKLASERGFDQDVNSIERGLRRLRGRGQRDGGVWGRRLLQAFGLPKVVHDRVRWMGHYHTRFTDLATSLCRELLLPWDRPPVSESSARVWVQLGLASVALRQRRTEVARSHLSQAAAVGRAMPAAAQIELQLVEAFVLAREAPAAHLECLERAETLLVKHPELDADTAACLRARLVDQQAYALNKPRHGSPDPAAALAAYASLPTEGPAFARCRRHNGVGWSLLHLGRREEALSEARHSVREAGDAGSLRLRAMALNLLAAAAEGDEASSAGHRASQIARLLEDEALWTRYARHAREPAGA